MRKKIIIGMLLLMVLLLPAAIYLQISQGFRLSVANAREGALHEEAVIAQAMTSEIRRGMRESEDELRQAAQKTRRQFSSDRLRILFYADKTPLTAGVLPESAAEAGLLDAKERCTYLSSKEEVLYVIHPLDERVRLITVSDFSGIYDMRREQITYGVLVCGGALVLAVLLALLFSRGITRSLKNLSRSADAIRNGAAFTLQPSERKDEIGSLTNAFIAMNGAVEKREESLREQARQRQQLVDALAHEMRTPLTTVIGAARMIQNDSAGTELRNEMCDLIVRESRRLSDMDANLMKLTQMNGAEPEMEEFSLAEAAREALEVTPEAVLSGEDSVVTADRDTGIVLNIPGTKLETKGDALHLILCALPAEAVIGEVSFGADAERGYLLQKFLCFLADTGLMSGNRDDNDLDRSDFGRENQPVVVAVGHDDRADHSCGGTPGGLEGILKLVVPPGEGDIISTGELITEVVGGRALQRLVVLHEALNGIGRFRTGKFFLFGLTAAHHRDGEDLFKEISIAVQLLLGFMLCFLGGLVNGMAFLPPELAAAQEGTGGLLPADYRTPLVVKHGKFTIRMQHA